MYRGRRLRRNASIRAMNKETNLQIQDLIYPLFVVEGEHIKEEISTLPNVFHYSLDCLEEVVLEMAEYGILSCILFGIPKSKDACGTSAYAMDGIVQKAIRKIKAICPQMYVIADVCMCEYSDHGHCGLLNEAMEVDNDATLLCLNKIALSYARSGVDMVAPSAMMDGQVASIREALDVENFVNIAIMGYSAKYASNFYGPFREAAKSAPSFGDRKAYQMDYANGQEAMREIQADIDEGADIIMVKPAMSYLDVVQNASVHFHYPLCAYQVSGEYAMLKLAINEGLFGEDVMMESLLAIKRAGAKYIITYEALAFAKGIRQ